MKTENSEDKWTKFFEFLFEKLSDYEVQKDTSRYNVANLNDWGKKNKEQGIQVTSQNIKLFLNKLDQYWYSELKDIEFDESKLKLVNDVLWTTLKQKYEVLCDSQTLTIKGDYIKVSDVKKEIENCSRKQIEVFSLNTIFIDQYLDEAGSKLAIVMVSPTLQIIGHQKINLDGKNGLIHAQRKAAIDTPGLDSVQGTSAGSLIAISKQSIDISNLEISVNGGNSSNAQEGGDGSKKLDGISPLINADMYYRQYNCFEGQLSVCNSRRRLFDFECREEWCAIRQDPYGKGILWCGFKISSNPVGENGKTGGNGALGGLPGTINIITEDYSIDKMKISNQNGLEGLPGRGGAGGLGSRHYAHVWIDCSPHQNEHPEKWEFRKSEQFTNAPSGNAGSDGQKGQIYDPPTSINTVSTLKRYKIYLRENVNGIVMREKKLIEFYSYLDSKKEIQNLYDVLLLVDEFIGLEEHYFELSKKTLKKENLLSFYKSFFKKLDDFVRRSSTIEEKETTKKVLGYIYSAMLSKMHYLESDADTYLVIKTKDYMDFVMNNFQILKKLEERKSKVEMIKKFKEDYGKRIDENIVEAKKLADTQISPKLDQFLKQMDDDIDALIKEIIELEKEEEKHIKDLEEKRKQLRKAMIVRTLFGCLKTLGAVVSFLGPIGAIAGTVIIASTSIAESITSEKPDNIPINLPENISDVKKRLVDIKTMKVAELKESIDKIKQEIQKHEELKDTVQKLEQFKKELESSSNKRAYELEALVKDELEKKQSELKKQGSKLALKAVEGGIQLITLGLDIYERFKSDQQNLDRISVAINQEKDNLRNLKIFEKQVHEQVLPMLDKMGDDLEKISKALDTKSHVSLDVTQWQVHSSIKNMRIKMKEITQGFKSGEKLDLTLDMIEESMNILIKVYDRIKTYEDQQNLSNYIANICTDTSNAISVTEPPEYVEAINKAEFAIRSNLVLKQYEISILAFKQWVFPFMKIYLNEKVKLPDQLKLKNITIQNLVDEAVIEVEQIKNIITVDDDIIRPHKKYIIIADFNSKDVTSKPFYTWKNEEHKELFNELMSGKKVAIRSYVENSDEDKDSIKFNLIEINFKSKNETIQIELDSKLKQFDIRATHYGDSKYRFDKKIYTIETPSQTIEYSFIKENGEPKRQNSVYKDIKRGDIILSPYTMWSFELLQKGNINFTELEKFKDKIDLELVGKGSYVKYWTNSSALYSNDSLDKIEIDSLEVDKQYKPDESLWHNSVSLINKIKSFTKNLFYGGANVQSIGFNNLENGVENLRLNSNSNDLIELNSRYDANSSLLLGQLIIGKIYGANKHLNDKNYLSPIKEREIRINELTKTILPVLNENNYDLD